MKTVNCTPGEEANDRPEIESSGAGIGLKTNGESVPQRQVFFFDIDNCLYPRSANVHEYMADLIHEYFERNLDLTREEAVRLHKEYYQNYGLAIEGLVRHHDIDPLEFNSQVDDSVPMQDIIKPRPELKKLLAELNRRQIKPWLFTNAYITHARRVIKILEIEDMFEGLTYCDYSSTPFCCKPQDDMFRKAMREAGVKNMADCYFVDDSYINCAKAYELGWNAAHLVEDGAPNPSKPASQFQISHIVELRDVFPHLFQDGAAKKDWAEQL